MYIIHSIHLTCLNVETIIILAVMVRSTNIYKAQMSCSVIPEICISGITNIMVRDTNIVNRLVRQVRNINVMVRNIYGMVRSTNVMTHDIILMVRYTNVTVRSINVMVRSINVLRSSTNVMVRCANDTQHQMWWYMALLKGYVIQELL